MNAPTKVQWDDGKYALVAKRFKTVGMARKYRDQLSADLHAQIVRMTPSNSPSYFAVLLPQTEKLGMDWSKWPEGTSLNDWIEVTELKKQNPQIVSNK